MKFLHREYDINEAHKKRIEYTKRENNIFTITKFLIQLRTAFTAP